MLKETYVFNDIDQTFMQVQNLNAFAFSAFNRDPEDYRDSPYS